MKHIDTDTKKVDVEIARGVVITVDKHYVFRGVEDTPDGQKK